MCYGYMSAQLQSLCSLDTTSPHSAEQVVPLVPILQAGLMLHKPEKAVLKMAPDFLLLSFSLGVT